MDSYKLIKMNRNDQNYIFIFVQYKLLILLSHILNYLLSSCYNLKYLLITHAEVDSLII